MPETPVTVFVCTSCGAKENRISAGNGKVVFEQLSQALADTGIRVEPVGCLSNCDRGVSVGFSSPGKFSWLFGDKSDSLEDTLRLASAAKIYRNLSDGFLAKGDRPKPVIARIPPQDFTSE